MTAHRFKRLLWQPAWLMACLALAMPVQAQQDEFLDLAGQLEYAYYANDLPALQRTLTRFEQWNADEARRGAYLSYLNYGRWKLAQLVQNSAAKTETEAAFSAARKCSADTELKLSPSDQAEHLALASACALMLETLRPLRGLLYRAERADKLQRALQMSPDNPQVKLIACWQRSMDTVAVSERQACAKSVTRQYETINAALGSTRWGSAEAWYLLARAQWEQRDVLAARDAIEQALVQAPDYRDAQLLMKTMSLSR